MSISEILEKSYFDNPLWHWLLVPAIIIGAIIVLRILRQVLVRSLRRFTEKTETEADDLAVNLIDNTRTLLMFFVALYLGTWILTLPETISQVLRTIALASLLVQAGLWATDIIVFLIKLYVSSDGKTEGDRSAIATLSFIARLILWTVVGLLILDNIPGVEITSLVTGLGISGIAVALAIQNILGDLFASLSILLDKPFVVGDFIVVGELSGSVESIGLKTTRVRALSGEELVFANSDLLNSRIHNYKKMQERRVVFTVGVTYEVAYETLVRIPQIIQEVIESQEYARFDRSHFFSFGDFSLNVENVYYMLDPSYQIYMDTQQAINLALFKRFQEEGIEFAYPTQMLYVSNTQQTA